MTASGSRVLERALAMRREFDATFAKPAIFDEIVNEKLLVIRAGRQTFAMRLSAIAGLFADKKITPVPGGHAALSGLAGFRGAIVPVYDLARLLGLTGAQSPRWLALAKDSLAAVAFEGFEAQLLVRPTAIVAQATRSELKEFAREFLRSPTFSGPILHLPSVLDAIGIPQDAS